MISPFIIFNQMAVNRMHVCTVQFNKPSDAKYMYQIKISLSNGVVLEEIHDNEDSAKKQLIEITGLPA